MARMSLARDITAFRPGRSHRAHRAWACRCL